MCIRDRYGSPAPISGSVSNRSSSRPSRRWSCMVAPPGLGRAPHAEAPGHSPRGFGHSGQLSARRDTLRRRRAERERLGALHGRDRSKGSGRGATGFPVPRPLRGDGFSRPARLRAASFRPCSPLERRIFPSPLALGAANLPVRTRPGAAGSPIPAHPRSGEPSRPRSPPKRRILPSALAPERRAPSSPLASGGSGFSAPGRPTRRCRAVRSPGRPVALVAGRARWCRMSSTRSGAGGGAG